MKYRVENVPEKVLSAANDLPQKAAIQNLLTQLGAQGWELAGVGANYYYFKRPK
jgi:hypothetical protein